MPIKARYPFTVDCDRDIQHLLCANGYETLASPIVLRQIAPKEKGVKQLVANMFMQQTVAGSQGVLWSMSTHLCRPLDLVELLFFGEKHPELQLMMPIIALGTIISLGNAQYVFGLTSGEGAPALRFFPYETLWSPEYAFAGTRT